MCQALGKTETGTFAPDTEGSLQRGLRFLVNETDFSPFKVRISRKQCWLLLAQVVNSSYVIQRGPHRRASSKLVFAPGCGMKSGARCGGRDLEQEQRYSQGDVSR